MTYFGFLFIFLGFPLFIVSCMSWVDYRQSRHFSEIFKGAPFWIVVFVHVLVAVLYTTPWDNYLVASGVWYYNPELVTGFTLGWVPIEEYIFFVLQTLLTGQWLGWNLRRFQHPSSANKPEVFFRWMAVVSLGCLWAISTIGLLGGWQKSTYLCLIFFWALPPIMLQFGFGGDIIWQFRRPVFIALVSAVVYLSSVDSLAISRGIWTIDSKQSLGIFIGGVLPLEELLFFLVTNALIVFGITLVLSNLSHLRFRQIKSRLKNLDQS